jgi:hypothetical protein
MGRPSQTKSGLHSQTLSHSAHDDLCWTIGGRARHAFCSKSISSNHDLLLLPCAFLAGSRCCLPRRTLFVSTGVTAQPTFSNAYFQRQAIAGPAAAEHGLKGYCCGGPGVVTRRARWAAALWLIGCCEKHRVSHFVPHQGPMFCIGQPVFQAN